MKIIVLCLLVAACAGKDLAHKQQDVLNLLFKTTEPIRARFEHLKAASVNYVPHEHAASFNDEGAAASVADTYLSNGYAQAQKTLWSLFNAEGRKEALMVFDVLVNAKDWVTFASSAAYYRERVNEGAFTYALYVSVIHSSLGSGIVLPPLYEVNPHMFANSEVIQKAQSAKMTQTPGKFRMDFTGSKKNPEQRVAYFGEDIGMNVHHVSWHMDYPFWWEDKYGGHLDRKGELFFWMHHQLTARFDSERLSNNLNQVDELYWDRPIAEGFAPHTTYRYGGEFPSRPDNIKFEDVEGVARIRDMMIMEDRIRDAIAHGYITGLDGEIIDIRNEHGIDILGDVIESSTYSPNTAYYGALHNLAHMVLGRQGDPKGKFNMPPGVMEHFETATRDPSFFRLHKYMDNIFKEHKNSLNPYTNYELLFPGVSVESVQVEGHLETYFEDFEFDLRMAVDDTETVADVDIKAIVSRLNHDDFSLAFDINNNNVNGKDLLGTIRVFLCPRRDANGIEFNFNEARWNCIETDKFWKTLKYGSNHIVRKSRDASSTVPDVPSFQSLIDQTDAAVAAGTQPDFSQYERSCGIPNRMLLPKGKKSGMEFSLLVVVSDGERDAVLDDLEFNEQGGSHTICGVSGQKFPDSRPIGFPLDRKVKSPRFVLTFPNFHKSFVTVTHRG